MRIVNQATEDAILATTYRYQARLTAYKSRVYFADDDLTDESPAFAQPIGDSDHAIPESIFYDAVNSVLFTVLVDDGVIKVMRSGSSTPITVTLGGNALDADEHSRPSIYDGKILYFDGTNWKLATYTPALLAAGTTACITGEVTFTDIVVGGAAHLISTTEGVILWIDEGGMRVSFIDTDGGRHDSPWRFMDPTAVLLAGVEDDDFRSHHSAAAKLEGCVFVYYSGYDGSMKGICYALSSNDKDGCWSDIFTALPNDLSTFEVANALVEDGRMFVCGRFSRKEEFETSFTSNLVIRSDNGFTFAVDRRVLITLVDLPFQMFLTGTTIYFSNTNRYFSDTAPYYMIGENTSQTRLTLRNLSGSTGLGWTANLKSGREEYYTDTNIDEGNFAKLEIGVYTGSDFTWVKYHDVVISEVNRTWADGAREMSLGIVPDGIWHVQNMTHPFYMEFQGKQPFYDPIKEFSNMVHLGGETGASWSLTVDFFEPGEYDGWTWQTHAGVTETDHWCRDLEELCMDYPVFGDAATYEARIYGWSRAGVPSTNPNTADATPTDTLNDVFELLILCEDEDGSQTTVVSDPGELTSTHDHPPQTWFVEGAREGSYPVIYNITNPGEGLKIIKVGVRVTSDTGNTTYYLERVEFPAIHANYIPVNATAGGWEVNNVSDKWNLVDTITLQITDGNDTAGDITSGAYSTTVGHVYAIMVAGEVAFTRNAIDYIQDAHFYAYIAQSDPNYRAPTWIRSYPPGTGPAVLTSVDVTAGTNPQLIEDTDTWDDSIPAGETLDDDHHLYTFRHDESADMESSEIDARYIPYVYGNGSPIDVALYLAGSGAISDIVGGEFKFYVFECPVDLADFGGYGGTLTGSPADEFDVVADNTDTNGTRSPTYPVPLPTGISSYVVDFTLTTASVSYKEIHIKSPNDGASHTYKLRGTYEFTRDSRDNPSYLRVKFTVAGAEDTESLTPVAVGYNKLEHYDEVTVGPNQDIYMRISNAAVNIWYSTRQLKFEFWSDDTYEPDNFQVPIPPYFNCVVPSLEMVGDDTFNVYTQNVKKGIPQILISSRPFSAWNFEASARYMINGDYSYAGVLGLETDKDNYLVGYLRKGYIGIAKVRDGVKTVLSEVAQSDIEAMKVYDIRFWHRDGLLGVEFKRAQDNWPERGSQLVYEWTYADDPLLETDDIMHVGAYSHIDPPRFRSTGFKSTSTIIPVMPLDIDDQTGTSDFHVEFASSGTVDVDGKKYTYTGKSENYTHDANQPLGPFQARNITNWLVHRVDLEDAHEFPEGYAIEFTHFIWQGSLAHYQDYHQHVIGLSTGFSWLNGDTFFKPWITTTGLIVMERERARFYSDDLIIDDWASSTMNDKCWITNGLTGVAQVETTDEEILYQEGTFVYIDSDDKVWCYGFTAASGDEDYTVGRLLDKLNRIAGTTAEFPGDYTITLQALGDGESVALQT